MAGNRRSDVMVGRAEEFQLVCRAVAAARDGSGSVVVVTGEAGSGKTRLLAESAGFARSLGLAVFSGRAVEGGGPFRPVAEALFPRLKTALSADQQRRRPFLAPLQRLSPDAVPVAQQPAVDPVVALGEGALELLDDEGGVLLVLEDLQWADSDTLSLVDYLAGRVPGSRIVVLVSSRGGVEHPAPLRRLEGYPGTLAISLTRLGPEAAGRLAVACAGGIPLPEVVRDFMVTWSEGLPLLVEELLAGLVDGGSIALHRGAWTVRGPLDARVPATLAHLVRGRLATLAPAARSVLDAAAIVGSASETQVLASVTGLSDAEVLAGLRDGVTASLLDVGDTGALRFRHALIRDAALAELLAPERAALAARAALAIATSDPRLAGPRAALVAELYAQAGDRKRANEVFVELARQAFTRGALQTAQAMLERAVALGAGAEAAAEQVLVLTFAGHADGALAVGDAALAQAAGEVRVTLLLRLARAAVVAGRWNDASAYLARTGRHDDPRVDALAADAAYGAGRLDEARSLAHRAADVAQRAGLVDVACEALEVLGRCCRGHDAPAAAAVFQRAADLAEEHALVPWRVRALLHLGICTVLAGDPGPLAQVRALALDAGMLTEVASADLLLADVALVSAGPSAAVPWARDSAQLAGGLTLSHLQAVALTMLATCAALAGQRADRDALLRRSIELAPDSPDVAGGRLGALGLSALVDRDLAAARDQLDGAVDIFRGHASSAPMQFWGVWALVRTILGDRDAAARNELRRSDAVRRSVNEAGLRYAEAIAAGRRRHTDEALSLLDAGDRATAGEPWWRGLLRMLVLEALLEERVVDPILLLRNQLVALEALDDPWLLGRCREQLRRAGMPVPRKGRGDRDVPDSLRAAGVTSREMDVLALVAMGLSNLQVAERLFLSPRTVETHVSHLLAKTGASTRGELADRAESP